MHKPTYTLTLHRTYFQNGFFNLGVDVERFVSDIDGPVTLVVGPNAQRIHGKINRRANRNGTPRIFGGAALRDWFQANFKVLERVEVAVLAPAELRISAPAKPKSL